ncbi:MAG: hypothetical protein H0V66_03740 [Bdellovibrionales bacterium]|nr:hypothetical protein [Bdellovibrionales bacterium]
MPKTKLVDNNRRTHAAKVLAETSKKNQEHEEVATATESEGTVRANKNVDAITGHYEVIRQDVFKLREDLVHGYELLKDWVETNFSRRTLFKSK